MLRISMWALGMVIASIATTKVWLAMGDAHPAIGAAWCAVAMAVASVGGQVLIWGRA